MKELQSLIQYQCGNCAVQSQERKNWQISLEFDILQFAKFLLREYYILGKKIEEIVYEI